MTQPTVTITGTFVDVPGLSEEKVDVTLSALTVTQTVLDPSSADVTLGPYEASYPMVDPSITVPAGPYRITVVKAKNIFDPITFDVVLDQDTTWRALLAAANDTGVDIPANTLAQLLAAIADLQAQVDALVGGIGAPLVRDVDHLGFYIPQNLIPDPDHPGFYLTTGLTDDPDHIGYYLIGA